MTDNGRGERRTLLQIDWLAVTAAFVAVASVVIAAWAVVTVW
jgi:hypothetical protein